MKLDHPSSILGMLRALKKYYKSCHFLAEKARVSHNFEPRGTVACWVGVVDWAKCWPVTLLYWWGDYFVAAICADSISRSKYRKLCALMIIATKNSHFFLVPMERPSAFLARLGRGRSGLRKKRRSFQNKRPWKQRKSLGMNEHKDQELQIFFGIFYKMTQ